MAVLERLREDPFLATTTFEGVVTNRPARYCTLFANNGPTEVSRFSGYESRVLFTYWVHSVGTTPDQAQLVGDHVLGQLLNARLSVAGRRCWPLRHPASQPVQIDRDVTPALWYGVDQFDLVSDPA
jgi:hypothetical protein